MKTYFKRFKSTGRISHRYRVTKLITGNYTIETAILDSTDFEMNINFPIFKTEKQAEKYLADRFELEE